MFLGYSNVRKGYRLYDVKGLKIVYSRDFVFNETETVNWFEKETSGKDSRVKIELDEDVVDNTHHDEHHVDSNSDEPPVVPKPPITERRSTRVRKHPDYYGVYINLTDCNPEPTTVDEALKGPDHKRWKVAMNTEMKSLNDNEVWELVDPPEAARVVYCKWIFRCKKGENGQVERYKARLVAQGYLQRPGLNYDETFSPVVRFESIRTVLALAAEQKWKVHQMDVTTAFLNGELHDTVYMKQPKGYVKPGHEQKVCRLKRSIYGLKQSPRCWNSVLDAHL